MVSISGVAREEFPSPAGDDSHVGSIAHELTTLLCIPFCQNENSRRQHPGADAEGVATAGGKPGHDPEEGSKRISPASEPIRFSLQAFCIRFAQRRF